MAAFTEIDWSDPLEEAIHAGLLRHEVRHAEQFDALGHEFFDLYEIAPLVGSWKVAGMPRGGILYGLIPAEMDANTAAAKFLRERRAQILEELLNSDDGVLARSHIGPGALSDLPTMMVAFLFMLREVAEEPGRLPPGVTFKQHLRSMVGERAANTWAALSAA